MKILLLSLYFFLCFLIKTPAQSFTQTGKATFYAKSLNGNRTANGEKLDNKKLTAAHRKLPFGTKVKVTNLSNKKMVIVRITDRGPFKNGYIIDLTQSAAKAIGMIEQGIAKVKIEVVK
ncbi:MAG: septal ring lytic transglycosylase RlpA family protein [Verrucomicrobia bacterium]|nr:septal ring lytic transglycosylase RlpA family protein [Cytophagales bacterium]